MIKKGKALDQQRLTDLALFYVGRYATSSSKLRRYLARKLTEREWNGAAPADIDGIVERCVGLGYINDRHYASTKGESLLRRGYGPRRVAASLSADGVAANDQPAYTEPSDTHAAAETFARKRKIGPFALSPASDDQRRKQVQAFLRAGHAYDLARRYVYANPGESPDFASD